MPYLYAAAGNIDATGQSLLGVVQWVLVAVCSLAIFSRFGDVISHRVLFGASALLALLSWIAIAVFGLAIQSGDTESMGWVLWVYVILWGISAGFSAQCFYALWGTELFPTQYRGGAQGIMFFLVRGALGIWSLVGVGAIMATSPRTLLASSLQQLSCASFFLFPWLWVLSGAPRPRARRSTKSPKSATARSSSSSSRHYRAFCIAHEMDALGRPFFC